ncbi:hypothetical protein [Desulfosarcina ovata]|uniref:Uncharacterized protein n=1 Tax=Desulfosarcina ovata subsp. ovata TaxID=2752305 RepID=A0A5K8A7X8_9BACT|nr:hypothetical protein [Desulfosarcina ovata]BBO88753.1 hypothetical protein DSCOOX_19330 [Desulfosarcina ovata subsp. ovata]
MKRNALFKDAIDASSASQRWRLSLFAAVFVFFMVPSCTTIADDLSGEDTHMAIEINAVRIERLARDQAATLVPHADMLRYTPPLPDMWPPGTTAKLTIYGYGSQPAPTGRVTYTVSTPSVEVVFEMAEDGPNVYDTKRARAQSLDRLQPRVRSHVDADIRRKGIEALLDAISTGKLTEAAKRSIRDSYQSWQHENQIISENIDSRHCAFFRWLNEAF